MIFCNTFFNFNINPCFALGNYFGSCLSNKVFGQPTNNYVSCPVSSFGFWGGFPMPTMPTFSFPSIFTGGFVTNFAPPQPTFSFDTGINNFSYPSYTGSTSYSTSNNTDTFTVNKLKNSKKAVSDALKSFEELEPSYNEKKGNNLAKYAKDRAKSFTGKCARYVSNALEATGLQDGMGRGHGYQMAGLLRKNKNFKEISVDGTDWQNLPAGCILCYDKGSQGYNEKYGHVEISTGDGTAVSDGVTHNIRKPDAIFIPV